VFYQSLQAARLKTLMGSRQSVASDKVDLWEAGGFKLLSVLCDAVCTGTYPWEWHGTFKREEIALFFPPFYLAFLVESTTNTSWRMDAACLNVLVCGG